MKLFIIGFICGAIVLGGVAWATNLYIVLQDQNGVAFGTVGNPINTITP